MSTIGQPGYLPRDLKVGVVHLGIGNFHRAHQAMYFDRLFNQALAQDWAICGVGLTPYDRSVHDALKAQGMRYTLVERCADGTMEARSIASIVDVLYAPDDPQPVIARLTDPATRIVTLTITEGGYNVSDATGEFDVTQPWIQRDVERGCVPETLFGLVVEALRRRREHDIPPFTVVSCDNLSGNGEIAQRSFSTFAALRDPELAEWISATVPFPNSMVDRITPATTDLERELVAETFGVRDAWPVVCEDFCQWILEDNFVSGRPPLESAGVQVVADVRPYEQMKLRLLNGSHQALAYFGYLLGYRYVHEAIADPDIVAFVRAYMQGEAEETLAPVPGVDLAEYESTLIARFANPYVKDTLLRVGMDGSDRISKFVLPVVAVREGRGQSSPLAAAIVASWAAFARGAGEDGVPIGISDRRAEEVARAVARQERDGVGFLRDPWLFADLADSEAFAPYFERTYREIRGGGARQALLRVLEAAMPKGGR